MAKQETPEPVPAPAPAPEKKKEKKVKTPKPRLEVPPLIDMTIRFTSTAFLLVSLLVALISLAAGCDLLTIFVRTMVTMIVAGMILWLVSWWVTQQFFEDRKAGEAPKPDAQAPEGLLKDVEA